MPKRLDFLGYEFALRFISKFLSNEKEVWFTKEIYSDTLIMLDVSQYSQCQFFLYRQYGSHIYNYITRNLRGGDVFLDIGANVGYFTLIASRVVGATGSVHAFEPEENNFKKLRKNVELNKLSNVSIYQSALSDSTGDAALYVNPKNEGGHSLLPNPLQETKIVSTIVFDEWADSVRLSRLRLCKIDVEGFELSVLKGMEQTLRNTESLEIICEVRRNQKILGDFMESLGYFVYELDTYGTPIKVSDIASLKRDFLFSRHVY
jgi:FkbM family methyltransferase